MKKNGKKGSKLALRLVCVLMLAALLCGMGLPAAGAEEEPAVTEPVITEPVITEQPAAETPVVTGGEEGAAPDAQESTAPAGEPAEEEENMPVLSEVPGVDEAEATADASAPEDAQATLNVGIMAYEGNQNAQVYFQKTPTSDPNSNDTDQWGSSVTYYGKNATVNTTGANWIDNKNVFSKSDPNFNSYIKSWPDGSTGTTWTLTDKTTYGKWFEEVYNTYKEELENQLGIENLTLDDIQEITLIPYKISKDNGGAVPTHIDCTISVKCSKAYVARFNVQWPGDATYTNVSAQNKKIDNAGPDSIDQYVNDETVPTIIVYNGITYRFDGWYNEAGNKVAEWPYTPSADELSDGTVNFYARYVPATTSITVTKKVSGNMGDINKEFNFTYSYTGIDGNIVNDSFKLMNGASVTISNIPIDAELTLTEIDANGYETTATYGETSVTAANGVMTFTVAESGENIIVTNNKNVTIDTGISLDTLPYVLLLGGMAVLGGALLLRRKVTRA